MVIIGVSIKTRCLTGSPSGFGHIAILVNVVKTGRVIGGVEYCDSYTHDHQGNVLTVLSAADSAKRLSFTEKYEYTYDGQISKTYYANNQAITNTYDYLGNLIRESWPTWNTTSSREYVYGSRNQQLQTVELYDWDALAATTTYTYNEAN